MKNQTFKHNEWVYYTEKIVALSIVNRADEGKRIKSDEKVYKKY